MRLYKNKVDKKIIYLLSILTIISLVSIYSAGNLIGNNTLIYKQIIWYILGYSLIFIITKIDIKSIFKHYKLMYILGCISLLLLLIFAKPINNSKCWFTFFNINIQPSEFMKIILIITNAYIINNKNKELSLIFKILVITLIPSILTFLEPDTGMVIIYFVISFVMLFISNINIKWFTYSILLITLIISIFLSLYFYNDNLFIKIFGTNFFYRIDRLLDWKNGTGYQLTNALTGIGSSYLFGFGFNNTPIYFPEAQTDFIFSVFIINYGFIGGLLLILVIILLDIYIINIASKIKYKPYKYIIIGILSMMLYQQIQNIGMNIGLLPITGITLPFISYGGSSLISYMISIGIILNITKNEK